MADKFPVVFSHEEIVEMRRETKRVRDEIGKQYLEKDFSGEVETLVIRDRFLLWEKLFTKLFKARRR